MYCVKCGIRLEGTEEKCPLCDTQCSIHYLKGDMEPSLYPKGKYPPKPAGNAVRSGAILFLFVMALLVSFFVDLQPDQSLGWSYYAAGAVVLLYVVAALPGWFRDPNPVVFVPCDFGAVLLYLLMIALLSGGKWFLPFALPVTGMIGLIVTTVVVLLRYLRKGRLYVLGGAGMALGGVIVVMELLMGIAFGTAFSGWSVYPLIVLVLLGGMLIFLAINKTAREKMERKFFL